MNIAQHKFQHIEDFLTVKLNKSEGEDVCLIGVQSMNDDLRV